MYNKASKTFFYSIIPIKRELELHWVEKLLIAYQTGFSVVFTSARKSHLTPPGVGWLVLWMTSWRQTKFMNECCSQMTSLKYLRKFIRYYSANISVSIKPICSDFYFKNEMQEKETITSNRYGWKFLALGWPRQSLGTA